LARRREDGEAKPNRARARTCDAFRRAREHCARPPRRSRKVVFKMLRSGGRDDTRPGGLLAVFSGFSDFSWAKYS
jgi:hypothetical protein